MSISFTNAVVAGLRKYGVTVHFWNGWQTRGNGQTSNYQGGIMHHTATPYGMAPSVLVNGRSDLSGPLCNSAGNSDGSVTIIAAHPANHAGASGGKAMGPLPTTGLFNKIVWGHEIVYPGDKPMTPKQHDTMIILGRVLSDILKRANSNWIRAHAETSITGKWDPGYAPGKTINMNAVRTEINNYSGDGGEDVMNAEQEKKLDYLTRVAVENQRRINAANAALVKANAAIAGLVTLVAKGSDLTVEDVKNAVNEALKDAVVDVDINVNKAADPV
jgi:hypothetical protein